MTEIEIAEGATGAPSEQDIQIWANAALPENKSVTIRVMEADEMQLLNQAFRGKDKPTNVLSFPYDGPDLDDAHFIGDIAICLPVVIDEAAQQNKSLEAHFAHMVVHGVLHLMGYDHQNDAEATQMEALETKILTELGFAAPYKDTL